MLMRSLTAFCAAALVLTAAGCSEPAPPPSQQAAEEATAPAPPPEVWCDCTLSSWVVAFRGRHLHLDIDCPEEYDHLDGRVEFTSASLRRDYDPAHPAATPGLIPQLVRMTPGGQLTSYIDDPKPRQEASYRVPLATAAWFQRDVAFDTAYVLTGANSNAAMRAMLERADLEIPPHVLNGSGAFGAFPGIDFDAGSERDLAEWPAIGLPAGPRPLPVDLPEWARPAFEALGRMGYAGSQ